MKEKILPAMSAMCVLVLTVAAFAFAQSNDASKTAAESCAMKGMNMQIADVQTKTSCCDKDNCCCKGDSCPMKSSDEGASANCCSCCGDSCPIKNKDAQASSIEIKDATAAKGESCCTGGSCCKSKHS